MSDASDVPEAIRLLARQAGLARALELFPDEVKAAAERGLRPLGELPSGLSSITHPAPVFDPAQCGRDE
jgi:hypothetical protein